MRKNTHEAKGPEQQKENKNLDYKKPKLFPGPLKLDF